MSSRPSASSSLELDLGALAEAALDRLAVEVPMALCADVDAAAGHPGAGPGADVAEHDGAARGHVLEGEALGVGAVDDAAAAVVESAPRARRPSTTSAPERRMQKRESAEPWTKRRPRWAP